MPRPRAYATGDTAEGVGIKQLDEIGRLLRITSGNVNQIAKRVNSGGGAYREYVAEVSGQLETIRASFGQVLGELSKIS